MNILILDSYTSPSKSSYFFISSLSLTLNLVSNVLDNPENASNGFYCACVCLYQAHQPSFFINSNLSRKENIPIA